MTHLLLDPQFGARTCGPVAQHMANTQVWPAATLHREIGVMQAGQVLPDLTTHTAHWDAAIGMRGLGFGSGPAAALTCSGKADRAILIDPAIGLAHDIDLTVAEGAVQPAQPSETLEELAAHLDDDPYPYELCQFAAQLLTPDANLRDRYARIWWEAERQRQPNDESIPLQPDSHTSEQLNWLHAWADPRLDITIWLSADRAPLASPLRAGAPGRPPIVQPWNSWT